MGEEDSDIVSLKTQRLDWKQTKNYVKDNLDIVKLRHRFDENLDVVYSTSLPKEYTFDEVIELHNNFGICATDKFTTISEGLARIKASLPINFDTQEYPSKVESETLKIASYFMPVTVSPDYSKLFDDLMYPNQPIQHANIFSQYYQHDIFKISYGSSLYWVFNGGTNYWTDDIYSFEHKISHDGYGLDVACLSENLPPLANRVTYQFTCQNTRLEDLKSYDISIVMQNKQTRSLLRPQKNIASIKLHCAIPKSVDLWWAQSEKALKEEYQNMPDYVLEDNKKTYYLRNDQSKYMRALVFDQDKQLIINTTSLVIDLHTEQTDKLEFESYGRGDKVLAKFKKESGIVYANVKIEKDLNRNTIYNVNNYKRIKLIEKVKINPPFQTRYLHNENVAEFFIIDGSSTFRVKSNSTEIATLNHLSDVNTVSMRPLSEGLVEITVEDYGVEKVETSTALLLVSDISKIELIGGGLMELGNSMNLTIRAFDSQGKEFEKDQLKFISLEGEIEKTGSSKREGLDIVRASDQNDTFIAHGISSGQYRVTVVSCKQSGEHERITSNFVRVQVFETVKIVPENILLFPGGRWTIQVEGGPQGGSRGSVYREYNIENPHICEIDEYGEIHAKHVGETWLHLSLFNRNNNVVTLLTSKKILVRVALVTDIEIPMMNDRSVFANSVTRLNVVLKHGKETFLHAIGPLSYEWSTSTAHIYSLSLPSKNDVITENFSSVNKANIWNGEKGALEDFVSNFNYSSVIGVAHKNGDTRIGVKMAIEYPSEYKSEKNFFYQSIKVKVTDKLTMNVPEFIEYPTQEPHIYVLPPLARNKIVTNKDTKVTLAYSIQTGIHYENGYECILDKNGVKISCPDAPKEIIDENPIIKIQDEGYIQTLDRYGKATIVIEESNSGENQIVMLNIMVTNIYSLSIEKPYSALNLPIGSETNLKVTLQEENARSFADKIEGVKLYIENSHPHVVEATLDKHNSTLNLNALGIGEANIRLYYKEDIFDVIRVQVLGSAESSSQLQLYVGGQVQFDFEDDEISLNNRWEVVHSEVTIADPVYGTPVNLGNKRCSSLSTSAKMDDFCTKQYLNVMNTDSVNLAIVMHVKKVDIGTSARGDSSRNSNNEYVVLLNVLLENGLSEMYPEIAAKNRPLVKHISENSNNDFAAMYITSNNAFVHDLQMRTSNHNNDAIKNLPSALKFTVKATSDLSSSRKYEKTFEIPLMSYFYINHPTRELKLYGDDRFKSVPITSSSSYNIDIQDNSDLVSYKIAEKFDRTSYDMQLSIPSYVKSDFSFLKVRMSSPMTKKSDTFLLSFNHKAKPTQAKPESSKPSTPIEESKPTTTHVYDDSEDSLSAAVSIGIILIMVLGIVVFIVYFFCLKSDNVVYELSDSSGLDSSSKERYQGFMSKVKKSTPIRSKMRYHYKE